MFRYPSSHSAAVLQAFFVTLLWSTSWVLIKAGLADLPALVFAGVRYSLAFVALLPFLLRPACLPALRRQLASLAPASWARLLLLGILYYTVTQGAVFVGLAYLPAMTVSLLLNFSPVVVALLSAALLGERPGAAQWLGVGLSAAGAWLYFHPARLPAGQGLGLAVVVAGVFANAAASILGRRVNRSGELAPLPVTVLSMGFGAILLLAAGLFAEGWPAIGLRSWAIIAWLALVNTAFAFTLWNHTLRTLPAVESSVINNTMLVQIAVLAWLFLGERLGAQGIFGLGLAGLGALAVQWRPLGRAG